MVPFHIISGERAKIWRDSPKSTLRQKVHILQWLANDAMCKKVVTIREWNKCNAFVFTIKIEWNDPIILGSSTGTLINFYGIAHLTATTHIVLSPLETSTSFSKTKKKKMLVVVKGSLIWKLIWLMPLIYFCNTRNQSFENSAAYYDGGGSLSL